MKGLVAGGGRESARREGGAVDGCLDRPSGKVEEEGCADVGLKGGMAETE